MISFIVRRLIQSVLIFTLAVSGMFVLIQLAPGDPISLMLGPRATPALIAAINERYGFDQPIPVQLMKYIENALQGDLGQDVRSRRPVWDIISVQLPYTLALLGASMVLTIITSIPLGCLAALKPGSFADRVLGLFSVSVIAIPALILGVYGLVIFAAQLRWVPAIGAGEPGNLGSQIHHLIVPVLAVSLGWIGYVSRIVRASMIDVMNDDFINSARSFGLTGRTLTYRYALRVAIAPVLTVIGIAAGYMLGSIVFIEIIFARPGIGKLMYDAVSLRNYPVVMGVTIVSTGILVVAMAVADILNALIDPRIREAQQ